MARTVDSQKWRVKSTLTVLILLLFCSFVNLSINGILVRYELKNSSSIPILPAILMTLGTLTFLVTGLYLFLLRIGTGFSPVAVLWQASLFLVAWLAVAAFQGYRVYQRWGTCYEAGVPGRRRSIRCWDPNASGGFTFILIILHIIFIFIAKSVNTQARRSRKYSFRTTNTFSDQQQEVLPGPQYPLAAQQVGTTYPYHPDHFQQQPQSEAPTHAQQQHYPPAQQWPGYTTPVSNPPNANIGKFQSVFEYTEPHPGVQVTYREEMGESAGGR